VLEVLQRLCFGNTDISSSREAESHHSSVWSCSTRSDFYC